MLRKYVDKEVQVSKGNTETTKLSIYDKNWLLRVLMLYEVAVLE